MSAYTEYKKLIDNSKNRARRRDRMNSKSGDESSKDRASESANDPQARAYA